MEVIQMTQKAAAMDNWWFTALPRQHACSYVMSRAGFFGETSNHPGDSAALQPRCGTLRLLAFPTTKITFERAEISDHRWDSGRYDGIADGNWENCVRSQGASFAGDWGIIVLYTMFLVSSSISVSIFHITWLDARPTGIGDYGLSSFVYCWVVLTDTYYLLCTEKVSNLF